MECSCLLLNINQDPDIVSYGRLSREPRPAGGRFGAGPARRVSSDRMDKAAVTGFGHVGFGVNRLVESTLTGGLVTATCRLAPGSSPSPGRRAVEGMRDFPDWWQRR
jgi:hypothetical protein